MPGILRHPVSRFLNALVYSGLILAHSHRKPAITTTGKCIAHQAVDCSVQLYFGLVLLQQSNNSLAPFPEYS